MLRVDSRLWVEARWFLVNYVLLNAVGFAFGVAAGIVTISSSADGSIPGYRGAPVEQVLWFAVGAVLVGPLVFGVPLLAAYLVIWRLLIRAVPRPRVTALLIAGVVVVLVAALVPRTNVQAILLAVAAPVFTYAAIVRPPKRTSA